MDRTFRTPTDDRRFRVIQTPHERARRERHHDPRQPRPAHPARPPRWPPPTSGRASPSTPTCPTWPPRWPPGTRDSPSSTRGPPRPGTRATSRVRSTSPRPLFRSRPSGCSTSPSRSSPIAGSRLQRCCPCGPCSRRARVLGQGDARRLRVLGPRGPGVRDPGGPRGSHRRLSLGLDRCSRGGPTFHGCTAVGLRLLTFRRRFSHPAEAVPPLRRVRVASEHGQSYGSRCGRVGRVGRRAAHRDTGGGAAVLGGRRRRRDVLRLRPGL